MQIVKVAALTGLAMIAFTGNSILCRIALKDTGIDAASFASIRLVFGAAMRFHSQQVNQAICPLK